MQDNHSKPKDSMLGEEPIGRLLLKLSVPSALGTLVHAFYNFVDMIFLGRWVGVEAIGGLIIAFPFQMLIIAMAASIANGSASMVSRYLGAGDRQKAYASAANGVLLAVVLAVITAILAIIFLDQLLRLFGATDALISYSRDYLSIVLYGAFFLSFGMVVTFIVRSEGQALVAMFAMMIGTVMNIILDPVFIIFLDMGIKGAAIATVISQALSAFFLVGFFLTGKSSLEIAVRHFRLRFDLVREIVSVGLPTFVRQTGSSVMMVVVNNVLGRFGGDIYISCFGIINRLFVMLYMTVYGIVQGMQPIVGYNYGALMYERVKKALRLTITVVTVLCSSAFLLFLIFPAQTFGIFTDDYELIQIGIPSLRLVILSMPFVGAQIIGASFFQAIGKARPALLLVLCRQFFFLIPFILILPFLIGVQGVFLAFPAADYLATMLTAFWFFREIKKFKHTPGFNEDKSKN